MADESGFNDSNSGNRIYIFNPGAKFVAPYGSLAASSNNDYFNAKLFTDAKGPDKNKTTYPSYLTIKVTVPDYKPGTKRYPADHHEPWQRGKAIESYTIQIRMGAGSLVEYHVGKGALTADHAFLPKVSRDRAFGELLSGNKISLVKIKFRQQNLSTVNLFNSLDPSNSEYAHGLHMLRDTFSQEEGEIHMYVREEKKPIAELLDKLFVALMRELPENDSSLWRKFYDTKYLRDDRMPFLIWKHTNILPKALRPTVRFNAAKSYGTLLEMTTRKGFAVIESFEYEEDLCQQVKATTAYAKFFELPNGGNVHYMVILEFEKRIEKNLVDGDVIWLALNPTTFNTASHDYKMRCIVREGLSWAHSGEVILKGTRPRLPHPTTATPAEKKIVQPYVKWNIPSAKLTEFTGEDELRKIVKDAQYVRVQAEVELSDITGKRQLMGIAALQRGCREDLNAQRDPETRRIEQWVPDTKVAAEADFWLLKRPIPVAFYDFLGDADKFLAHLTDEDHISVRKYLQKLPDRRGVIEGPPGVGKTFFMAEVIAAKHQCNTAHRSLIITPSNQPADVAVEEVKRLFLAKERLAGEMVIRGHPSQLETEMIKGLARSRNEEKFVEQYPSNVEYAKKQGLEIPVETAPNRFKMLSRAVEAHREAETKRLNAEEENQQELARLQAEDLEKLRIAAGKGETASNEVPSTETKKDEGASEDIKNASSEISSTETKKDEGASEDVKNASSEVPSTETKKDDTTGEVKTAIDEDNTTKVKDIGNGEASLVGAQKEAGVERSGQPSDGLNGENGTSTTEGDQQWPESRSFPEAANAEQLMLSLKHTLFEEFGELTKIIQGSQLPDGTLDLQELEAKYELTEMVNALTLARDISTKTGTTGQYVNDPRFKQYESSLAWNALCCAGVEGTIPNNYTSKDFSDFVTFFDRLVNEGEDKLTDEDRQRFRVGQKDLLEYTLRHASVLVMPATSAGAAIYVRNFGPVNDMYFDEAGRLTFPDRTHPIVRYLPENTIDIGDPKQLSPVVPGPRVPTGCLGELRESPMESLLNAEWPSSTLFLNRRSAKGIIDIPSKIFYGGKLLNGPYATDPERHPVTAKWKQYMAAKFTGLADTAVVYIHTESRAILDDISQSIFNLKNASLVGNLIEDAVVNHGFAPESFAIIAAYSAQVRVYAYLIKKLHQKHPTFGFDKISIHTFDSFQGGQRRITVTDFVFTDKLGFNRERGRPNVATTRGQDGAIIIGRTDLALDPTGTNAVNYVRSLFDEARNTNIRVDLLMNDPLLIHQFAEARVKMTTANQTHIAEVQAEELEAAESNGQGGDIGGWSGGAAIDSPENLGDDPNTGEEGLDGLGEGGPPQSIDKDPNVGKIGGTGGFVGLAEDGSTSAFEAAQGAIYTGGGAWSGDSTTSATTFSHWGNTPSVGRSMSLTPATTFSGWGNLAAASGSMFPAPTPAPANEWDKYGPAPQIGAGFGKSPAPTPAPANEWDKYGPAPQVGAGFGTSPAPAAVLSNYGALTSMGTRLDTAITNNEPPSHRSFPNFPDADRSHERHAAIRRAISKAKDEYESSEDESDGDDSNEIAVGERAEEATDGEDEVGEEVDDGGDEDEVGEEVDDGGDEDEVGEEVDDGGDEDEVGEEVDDGGDEDEVNEEADEGADI